MKTGESWEARRARRVAIADSRLRHDLIAACGVTPTRPQVTTCVNGQERPSRRNGSPGRDQSSHRNGVPGEPIIPRSHYRRHPHTPSWL